MRDVPRDLRAAVLNDRRGVGSRISTVHHLLYEHVAKHVRVPAFGPRVSNCLHGLVEVICCEQVAQAQVSRTFK